MQTGCGAGTAICLAIDMSDVCYMQDHLLILRPQASCATIAGADIEQTVRAKVEAKSPMQKRKASSQAAIDTTMASGIGSKKNPTKK